MPFLGLVHCCEIGGEVVVEDCGDGAFDVPIEGGETSFYKSVSEMR
jgi:hypothetical protein